MSSTEQRHVDNPTQIVYDKDGPVVVLNPSILRVVSGPDMGACCTLELRRVQVGTFPDNDLVLEDPAVSRYHLEFLVCDQGYLVRDLQSTNGTFYRGARISEAVVGRGAEIRAGQTVLRIDPLAEQQGTAALHSEGFGSLIGRSRKMQEVYGVLAAVAPADVTVLIEGETGTGKELIAEELHRNSPRRNHPFRVVDCGAMPAELIESELFGHERGAFTGAVAKRIGVFEETDGGVLFLDEVGELPLPLQTRLLRVLEQRVIKRVGSNTERRVDVRVVAATNRDLRLEVQSQRFRQDLYYRLAVVRVVVPPLRDRSEDVPLLARHFLWEAACPDPDAVLRPSVIEALTNRQWPGNVRELRNAVERAVLFAGEEQDPFDSVQRLSIPAARGADDPDPWDQHWLARALPAGFFSQPYKAAKQTLNSQFEIIYLKQLLKKHGRNISHLAAAAEIDRHMIRKLMRKHGLDE